MGSHVVAPGELVPSVLIKDLVPEAGFKPETFCCPGSITYYLQEFNRTMVSSVTRRFRKIMSVVPLS